MASGAHEWATRAPTPGLRPSSSVPTPKQLDVFEANCHQSNATVSLNGGTLQCHMRFAASVSYSLRKFASSAAQPTQLETFLGNTPKQVLLKMHKHAKVELAEKKRIASAFSGNALAAHKAAVEYLESQVTPRPRPRREFADKYEVTEKMMRTAERHIRHPLAVSPPGPKPLLDKDDLYFIGNYVIDRALANEALNTSDLALFMDLVATRKLKTLGDEAQAMSSNPVSKSSSNFHYQYTRLKEYWDNLDIPLVEVSKTANKEKARAQAEVASIPCFIEAMKRLHQAHPIDAGMAKNYINLDEQPICDQPSNNAKSATVQAPKATGGIRSARARSKAPLPVTMVSVTSADGDKGPAIVMRKGSTPWLKQWFTQLPPGLTQMDILEATWACGDSDRMNVTKFLDVLENTVLPWHASKDPTLKIWLMDAPV